MSIRKRPVPTGVLVVLVVAVSRSDTNTLCGWCSSFQQLSPSSCPRGRPESSGRVVVRSGSTSEISHATFICLDFECAGRTTGPSRRWLAIAILKNPYGFSENLDKRR
uniref:Putative secreted protein n=1 Tax=Anopheles darlingi TaxID=43151 RepID=A0A2M4DLG8_ANODA